MASSVPYPPWSAPATLEREKKSKWQAFKWFRRSGKKKKEQSKPPPKHTREESMEDRYNISPFAARPNPFAMGIAQYQRSPLANYTPGEARKSKPATPAEQPKGLFDPDALVAKPNRPSLANVFPMYDSPSPPTRTFLSDRRHSIPASPPPPNLLSPDDQPRRPSRTSASSDTTSERLNRRERRANAIREIPLLPNQLKVEKQSVYNSPYRQPSVMGYAPFPPYMHKPRPVPNSFSFPPWPQPHEQLQELEEELEQEVEVEGGEDPYYRIVETPKQTKSKKLTLLNEDSEDDIKGFDGFMMY